MIVYDSAFILGVACLAYAGYQVHPALAWCVGGVVLAYFGVAGALQARKAKR